MDTSFTWYDLRFMLDGAWVTIRLTLWAMLLGTAGGMVFGLLRTVYPRASLPLAWLLDVFRSIPLLIQFVLWNSVRSILALEVTTYQAACVVLGLFTAAYCAEVVRSGLESVPPTLYRAGRSLGMTGPQCMVHIVFPIATRVAFPGWMNLFLSIMKDTSLVLWIGVIELLRASQAIVTRIQEPLFVLCITGAIYYGMSLVLAQTGSLVERRWRHHD